MRMEYVARRLRFNRRFWLPILAAMLLLMALPATRARAQSRDPQAEQIAKAAMQAMGGENAWNSAHFVRFDFIVTAGGQMRASRSHLWDKWSGRYRFEQKTNEGKSQVILFNVKDQQGSVYLDGGKMQGEEAAAALKGAYGAFINDMYWLAMPWKWLDQGVSLKYMGPQEREGKKCDVVELTFKAVGITPGDMYHAYVDQGSKLMTYWEYTLQSGQKGAWKWEYGAYNGVKLASNHTNAEGGAINMGKVAVLSQVDDAFFSDAAKMMAGLQ